jgi:hypothetical protein
LEEPLMWRFLELASGEVKAEAGHLARRALTALVSALVVAVLLLFALAAVLMAVFFWLAPDHGPVVAALLVAALAFLFAVIVLMSVKLAGGAPVRQASPKRAQPLADLQGASPLTLTLGALALGLFVGRKL